MKGSVASSDAGGALARALPTPAACVVEPLSNGIPLLLWVRSGTMHADVAGQAHVVTAGRGLWVPAGVEHSLTVADGGGVVPVLLMITNPPPLLDAVAELDVPPAWGDWLLQQFARTQGYLCASAGDLGELLDGADTVTPHDEEAASGTDAGAGGDRKSVV